MIHTRCPKCRIVLQAEHMQRGRKVQCPQCGQKFTPEPVGWWDKVMYASKAAQGAKEAEGQGKHKTRHIRGVMRPYQRIDASILDEIPDHHKAHLAMVMAALVVVAVAVALVLWIFWGGASGPGDVPAAPPLTYRPPPLTPTPPPTTEDTPEVTPGSEEDATEEEFPEITTTAPSDPSFTRWPVASLPPYAHEVDAQIRVAGYRPRKGFHWAGMEGYCFSLADVQHLYFVLYAADRRVMCQAFIACEETASKRASDSRAQQKVLTNILSRLVSHDAQALFTQWVRTVQKGAARTYDASREFTKERRFGGLVVRVEVDTLGPLGRGISVEIARDYKPSTAISNDPPVRAWRNMRRGVTLAEVSAFAGPGKLATTSGVGEWMVEVYDWPNGGQVSFRNGRTTDWKAPSAP